MSQHNQALQGDQDDPDSGMTLYIGIVGSLLLIFCIVSLQASYYYLKDVETERKVYSQAPEELVRLKAEQLEKLHSYNWVNQEEGVVSIPIDEAIKKTAKELSGTAP